MDCSSVFEFPPFSWFQFYPSCPFCCWMLREKRPSIYRTLKWILLLSAGRGVVGITAQSELPKSQESADFETTYFRESMGAIKELVRRIPLKSRGNFALNWQPKLPRTPSARCQCRFQSDECWLI
jgi:hypothetical protein